ncbi:MAG: capsid cement protein [Dehalococcoidia bacterium]
MSHYDSLGTTVPAGSDLSSSQYRGMLINASGQLAAPSAGGRISGILQNDPAAAGRAGELLVSGRARCEAGGAVTAGDYLAVDALGRLTTRATNQVIVGQALESASGAGSYFDALIVGITGWVG